MRNGCAQVEGASITRHRQGPLAWVEVSRPELREFYVTGATHDAGGTSDIATQAAEVYGALGAWLRQQGATGVQERIFGSLAQREAVLARRQALLFADPVSGLWPATFLEGDPCDGQGWAGVHLYAVAGPGCSPIHHDNQLCGVAFEHRDTRHVYLGGVSGLGPAAARPQEAEAMFARADTVLRATGCEYADVVRTWIYLADIVDWYAEFNSVRSAFHSECCPIDETGSHWPPASTGIEARVPGSAPCLLDLLALCGASRSGIAIEALRNPRQSEAYSYGSAFSRGMAISFDGVEVVYVSGTAAIDERGESVCRGDLAGQVGRTLDNVASLLGTRHMTLDDIVSSTIFVKHGQDAKLVRELIGDQGALGANGVWVAADVCRPELLFEVDGIAARTSA